MDVQPEETAGYAKTVFMFEFPKTNLSGIDYGQYSRSAPCVINNLSWRILITKRKAAEISKDIKGKDTLGIYLECLGKSNLWSCYALVRFTLVSQKPGICKHISLEFKHLFSAVSFSQGYHAFITWDKLTDAEYGYIYNDTIRIQAYVEADPPNNLSTLDYNMEQPQSFDDWLSLFEKKLNDKIVRRISDEVKRVHESMISFGKLSEEIKGLNMKIERVHNRGLRIMSEFLTRCLKMLTASFHSKMDSLKLENFHTELVSVLGELRRIRSVENEDQADKKSRSKSEANSNSERESNPDTAEASEAQAEIKKEPRKDRRIIKGKVHETVTTSRSSVEINESISRNGTCKNVVKKRVASKRVVAEEIPWDFFPIRTSVSSCQRESSKSNQPRSETDSKVDSEPSKIVGNDCSEMKSVFHRCSTKDYSKFELGSQPKCSFSPIESKCLKRKLEIIYRSCLAATTEPPKKSKCLQK